MSENHDPYDHNPADADWTKSPFSADDNGSCVIIARFPNGDVWLGDDKHPDRPHLAFNSSEWTAFAKAVESTPPTSPPDRGGPARRTSGVSAPPRTEMRCSRESGSSAFGVSGS